MESLADEIIDHIFKYLTISVTGFDGPARDTVTFYHLCLVSRRFNQIATPFLFETYEHHATPSAPSKLLCTLARRPILAENIKVIRHKAPFERYNHKFEYPPIDKALVLAISKKLELPESTYLDWRLSGTGDDLELAMLLFEAKNLERLYIQTWPHKINVEPSPYWQMPLWVTALTRVAFGESFGKVHRFSALSHLYLDVHRINAAPLFLLFTIPSLIELTLCHWGETEFMEQDPGLVYGRQWTWPVQLNNIKRLIFKLPFVSPRTMFNAIRSCKALKTFEIFEGNLKGQGYDGNRYTEVSAALVAHRDSLEELLITDVYNVEFSAGFGTLNMVHELIHLKVLKVPFYILVWPEGSKLNDLESGDTLVPPSIEKLVLLYDEDTEADDASKYFEILQSACADGRLPYLNTIQLWCRFTSRFTHDCLPIDIWDTDTLFRPYGVTIEYYVQLCIWIHGRRLTGDSLLVSTAQDEAVIQEWETRLKQLPNLIRIECEHRNIVATNLAGEKIYEDERYNKRHLYDERWRLN